MNYKTLEYVDLLIENHLLVSHNLFETTKNITIKGVEFDSRKVLKDSIFFIKGKNFNNKYLFEAKERGAAIFIREKSEHNHNTISNNYISQEIIVNDIEKAMGIVSDKFYDSPWKKINLIGITGTKGKSTTAFCVKSILDTLLFHEKAGISSGILNFYGEEEEEAVLTTPESIRLYEYIYTAVKNKLKYMVVEVSSQGIKRKRLEGIEFDIGCFLNFGEDHISDAEHPDMTDYFMSKIELFKHSVNSVINIDDPKGKEIVQIANKSKLTKKIITFGTKNNADIRAYGITEVENGTKFKVIINEKEEEFFFSIRGEFNVSNALCAIGVCTNLGIPISNIKEGLKNVKVPNRMEVYKSEDGKKNIIIDYAHNDMSYSNLLQFVKRTYPNNKIYIVFGCVGEKAEIRREVVGEIIGKEAEMAYITSNRPGKEIVEKICKEIAKGMDKVNGKYEIVIDRQEAINRAINQLDEKSILIITGNNKDIYQFKTGKFKI